MRHMSWYLCIYVWHLHCVKSVHIRSFLRSKCGKIPIRKTSNTETFHTVLTFDVYSYENAFILSQLYDAHEPMWIGFTNKMRQSSFLWTDQSSVDYTNWYSRQPWWRRYFNRRDCVQFKPEYRYRGRWVDANCNVEAGFICQKRKNYWYYRGNTSFYTLRWGISWNCILNWKGSHCVRSVPIRSFSGLFFPAFGLNTERYSVSQNTDQKNSEYGQFSRSKLW